MKVAGDYMFDAPQRVVWDGLQDPAVLKATLPGCDHLDLVGENEYDAVLNIKIGPVQGKFKGKVKLEDIDEPNSYTMKISGQGAPGFVKATAGVSLSSVGDQTKMAYDSDAQVGGRIASVGQRLLDSSAKAIIKQSLEALNENMKVRAAAAAGPSKPEVADADASEAAAPASEPPPVVEVAAPSQAEFAANVAKEVAKDLIPKPVLIGGILAILALLAWLLFA